MTIAQVNEVREQLAAMPAGGFINFGDEGACQGTDVEALHATHQYRVDGEFASTVERALALVMSRDYAWSITPAEEAVVQAAVGWLCEAYGNTEDAREQANLLRERAATHAMWPQLHVWRAVAERLDKLVAVAQQYNAGARHGTEG